MRTFPPAESIFFQSVKLWEALYVRMITYLIISELNMCEGCNGKKPKSDTYIAKKTSGYNLIPWRKFQLIDFFKNFVKNLSYFTKSLCQCQQNWEKDLFVINCFCYFQSLRGHSLHYSGAHFVTHRSLESRDDSSNTKKNFVGTLKENQRTNKNKESAFNAEPAYNSQNTVNKH